MAMTSEARKSGHCHTPRGRMSEPGTVGSGPGSGQPLVRGVVMSDPTPDAIAADLFWSKADRSGGPDACWPWLDRLNHSGYGTFWITDLRAARGAHRIAYILNVGPIPPGLQLDHLCRVRHCVNPAHLEPVTLAENLRRGAEARRSTHCPHGHEWTPENTIYGNHGYRMCRKCRVLRTRLSRWRARGLDIASIEELPPPRWHHLKTECKWGHDLTDPDNVMLDSKGHRHCRACAKRRNRELSAKRKAERQARRAS